jgi:hypothetical protein
MYLLKSKPRITELLGTAESKIDSLTKIVDNEVKKQEDQIRERVQRRKGKSDEGSAHKEAKIELKELAKEIGVENSE